MITCKNPILSGFYPDPSICRVGEWFYLVTSTFAYFPGIPVFRSRNLAQMEWILLSGGWRTGVKSTMQCLYGI